MCGFCNVWVCVCVGLVMCGCVYVWVCMCGFCDVWVCVCVGVCMCGFSDVWVYERVCLCMCVSFLLARFKKCQSDPYHHYAVCHYFRYTTSLAGWIFMKLCI